MVSPGLLSGPRLVPGPDPATLAISTHPGKVTSAWPRLECHSAKELEGYESTHSHSY